MSKKWIISDLHLGHQNILKYSGDLRGGSSPEEHDRWIIDQWNSVVQKCDLVYVLGDVAMNKEALHLVKKLKGQKHLVRGNHDVEATKLYLDYFDVIHGMVRHRGTFWMTHCPMHPQELRGLKNIHGHVHQNSITRWNPELNNWELDPNYINVCVEISYGVPHSLDRLYEQYKDEVMQNKMNFKNHVEN